MPSESVFQRPVDRLTRFVLRWPKQVVVVATLSALAAIVVTAVGLQFRTNRLDLLNPRSEYNQRWLKYLQEFGDQDEVLVVMEGDDTARLIDAMTELGKRLNAPGEPFRHVMFRYDPSALKSRALQFASLDQLEQLALFLQELHRLAAPSPARTAEAAGEIRPPDGMQPALAAAFAHGLEAAARGEPYECQLPDLPSEWGQVFEPRYLLSTDGRMGFVNCRLSEPQTNDSMVRTAKSVGRLRELLREVSLEFPELTMGATGLPVLEHDEMASSQTDMALATVVSFGGVLALLVAGFGNWRYSLIVIVVLLIGMAWSFGFVTIVIGHLNILSISFAAILIGLGIDFGIHYVSRYLDVSRDGLLVADSMVETARSIGPGVITGAVTTAFSFYAAGATDFTGVAELGIIAGSGVLLCLLAALLVVPPLVVIAERPMAGQSGTAVVPLQVMPILNRFFHRPWWTVGCGLALAIAVAPGLLRVRYDHNLLNMQSAEMPSVRLQRQLIEREADKVWFAVSMSPDLETLEARQRKFEQLPGVAATESIFPILARPAPEQQRQLDFIYRKLAELPPEPSSGTLPINGLMESVLARTKSDSKTWPVWNHAGREIERETLRRRLAAFRREFLADVWERLRALAAMSDPSPLQVDELPAEMRTRMIGKTGIYLTRVYCRGDIWNIDALQAFVESVERVDPQVTGHPIQTYYASRQMQSSYLHSAAYALVLLLIVLVIDFRALKQCLWAMLPLGLGVLLLLGTMGMFEIPFNAANMIVLPLILGIGIDSGVHVVHDMRTQTGSYRLTNSVAVSILICSATTMTGFCSMIFASHRGLRSLGQVLTLGIFYCLVSSLIFMPALLTALSRRSKRATSAAGFEPAAGFATAAGLETADCARIGTQTVAATFDGD